LETAHKELRAEHVQLQSAQDNDVSEAITDNNMAHLEFDIETAKRLFDKMEGIIKSEGFVDNYEAYRDHIFRNVGEAFKAKFGPKEVVAGKRRRTTE